MNTADQKLKETIITLERQALEKWNNGNPSGYLDLSSQNVVYFDPFLPARLNGHKALTEYYEKIRGTIHIERYEMLNPKVQMSSDMAVLTFNLVSHEGNNMLHWNCTEVFQLQPAGWKIIQTHWSFCKV